MTVDDKRVVLPTNGPPRRVAANVGRFFLLFLELQIPMVLGASVCYLLGLLVPPSSSFAVIYHPGTYLFAIGDALYLSGPVTVWMIFRGHGRRTSLSMAVAMLVPVAAISLVGHLAGLDYLTWLVTAGYPAMSLGMLVYMALSMRSQNAARSRLAPTA